jgi:hypothetical protein
MELTLKIALVSAIAVIIAALIKLLGDLSAKGASRGSVLATLLLIILLLGSGAAVLFLPLSIAGEPPSSTPNQNLQFVLLRESCKSEYVVNANEPILIYYGGWSVKGMELAQQWTSALDVSISVDGSPISGEQHPPAEVLPLNCKEDQDDVFWLYYTTTVAKLSPGPHEISVTFNILKSLSDGLESATYPVGMFGEFTFNVTAR